MEEREYFRELCMGVLQADRNIRFAGVIDDTGKLLVGEYRKDIESPLIKASRLKENVVDSNGISNSSLAGITNGTFLASRMIFALNKQFEGDLGHLNYQLTEYGKVKLLTIALSNENNYYLCVSIDPVKNCHPVVLKVLKSI
ncbi:MAG: hypothetical protein QXX64_04875 [Nitrososphaera sp.]|uniref:Roadblock/LAMTOR2 domain-containing protein n=1 Tax=Nitrososphaera gargensis (strain Ga9.2) TaxID=1237085 RepID=K0ICS6_NITGG|nr:hypothetical protein [Candidatus Nitrososphaera gargensis]AFU59166.1 hypothetical protein Ngar_c22360 [Candidatus Nitrososphaera gargensis Ga9.2]